MAVKTRLPWALIGAAVIAGNVIAACGTSSGSSFPGLSSAGDGGSDDGSNNGGDSGQTLLGSGNEGGTTNNANFTVTPATAQVISVPFGTHAPTQVFTATSEGNPADAKWQVDRGDLGTINAGPSSTGTFVPSGTTGGVATITASYGAQTQKRQITVNLTSQQSGASAAEQAQVATTVAQLTAGGGVGGVGGEGLGGAVNDPAALAALAAPTTNGSTQNLKLLYPYDGTVWPRGILAPELQWDWTTGDADAIRIDLATTSGSFTWTGTFSRPAILTTTLGKYIRSPIPQDIWAAATNTAGGTDKLNVKLTIEKAGVGYGPLTQSWTIAPGLLSGVIYYNSYGTQLAQNSTGAVGGNGMFGGAVLSIHVGDSGPKLAAGTNGSTPQCRVCHSVAAGGSRFIVQHGDNYAASSEYDISTTGTAETAITTNANFAAVYPDGSKMLNEVGELRALPADGTLLPSSGLTAITTSTGPPAFSPDGKLVAFNPMAGPLANPTQKLGVMNFDTTTGAFTNFLAVVDDTGQPAETRPGWPAFLPDGKSLVFHQQSAAGNDGNSLAELRSRSEAKAQINIASTTAAGATVLNNLNGVGYLPKLSIPSTVTCTADGNNVTINTDHADDVNTNYEPTVCPVGSGGYAWVVFTTRRMYGNVATIPPFCSDPRGVDLINNVTTKKLWVAAIDLNAPAGTDASHPAFYLPGQELLAGNARGFWVLDPCRTDGSSCASGDECCNGYCEANGDGGALICSNTTPTCASTGDKCVTAGDCCDNTETCTGGFCTQSGPVN